MSMLDCDKGQYPIVTLRWRLIRRSPHSLQHHASPVRSRCGFIQIKRSQPDKPSEAAR